MNTVDAGDGVGRAYTVRVTNNGPSTATGVVVSGPLPSGTQANGGVTTSNGVVCASGLPCTLGAIAAGTTVTVVVPYQTLASAAGPQQNYTASVTSTSGDTNAADDSATDSDNVVRRTDLTVTLTPAASVVGVGQDIVYSVTVSNNGPADATGATVTLSLPAGLTAVSTGCGTGATCTIAGPLVAGATFGPYVVQVSTGGASTATTYVTNATVAAGVGQTDTNVLNNVASAPVSLVVTAASADLRMTLTDGGATQVSPGQSGAYVATVRNLGPSNATNVTVTVDFPFGDLSLNGAPQVVAGSVAGTCTVSATQVVCLFSNVPSGSDAIVQLGYTAQNPAGPTVTVVARAASAKVPDSVLTNNQATDTNGVVRQVDLGVSVSDGETQVVAGDGVVHTYVV